MFKTRKCLVVILFTFQEVLFSIFVFLPFLAPDLVWYSFSADIFKHPNTINTQSLTKLGKMKQIVWDRGSKIDLAAD